jgi:hypothetical protein
LIIKGIIQRNYLAKWTVIGLLIGIIARVGSIAFYLMIQFVTNSMLGGITGFYPPTLSGSQSVATVSVHPDFWLVPLSPQSNFVYKMGLSGLGGR